MATRMITASQKAMAKMAKPAATGWAPIQATRLSNQALTAPIMAAGDGGAPLQCGDGSLGFSRSRGLEGRQFRADRADALAPGRSVRAPRPAPCAGLVAPARVVAGAS